MSLASQTWGALRGAFAESRRPGFAWARAIVAAAWLTVALCALLALTERVHFTFRSTSDVQGWVTVQRYPKQQETFWFLASVGGVPAVILAGGALWAAASALGAALARCRPGPILGTFALAHLPLLMAWPAILRLRTDAWTALVGPACVALPLGIATVLAARFVVRPFILRHRSAERAPAPVQDTQRTDGALRRLSAAPRTRRQFAAIRIAGRVAWVLVALVIVPVCLYLLLADWDCNGLVDLFHEGEFLMPMDALLRGGVPYRDVYLQHGLLYNAVFPLLGAETFEPTLAGVRMIRACLYPMGYIGAYFLVLFACRTHLVAAAFLAFLFCGSVTAIPERAFFGLLSAAALAGSIVTPRGLALLDTPGNDDSYPGRRALLRLAFMKGSSLLCAGALAMLAFWHSVEVGLYALAAGAVFLIAAGALQRGVPAWRRPLPLAMFAAGAAVVFAPVALYLAAFGAFDDMIENVRVQCAYQIETWGKPFPAFFATFKPVVEGARGVKWPDWLLKGRLVWYYTPILLVLSTAVLAFRAMGAGFWRSKSAPRLLLTVLVAAAFFRTAMGRSDGAHLHYGVLFGLILAVCLTDSFLAAAWGLLTARGAGVFGRLAALPWLAAAVAAAWSLVWFGNGSFKPADGLRRRWAAIPTKAQAILAKPTAPPRYGPVVIPTNQATQLTQVVEYIRAHTAPGEPVFDLSSASGILFLADRPSATRYFHTCYACLPSMQQELVRDLERHRVSLVIYRTGNYSDAFDGVPVERRHPIVAAYLHANYEHATNVNRFVFWRRKNPPGRAPREP